MGGSRERQTDRKTDRETERRKEKSGEKKERKKERKRQTENQGKREKGSITSTGGNEACIVYSNKAAPQRWHSNYQ